MTTPTKPVPPPLRMMKDAGPGCALQVLVLLGLIAVFAGCSQW